MRDPRELTDTELRERIVRWNAIKRVATENVEELRKELLRRKLNESQDGYWSAWGFVPE